MEFLTLVDQAAELVAAHDRVTLRGLARHLGTDVSTSAEVADELTVRGVAIRDGDILVALARLTEDHLAGAGAHVAPPAGERRHLTVMFCDVVDSTELSTHTDVESWHDSMRAMHNHVTEAIESTGGLVGNFMGDGLVAYFGYPIAQEDAAERAVRAGLAVLEGLPALNRRLGRRGSVSLRMRVGIHTGPVVMDEFDGVVQALGDTANLAARIEGAAPVDGLAISPATRRLVSGVFITEDMGEHALKGIRAPVSLTRVRRVGGSVPRLGRGRRATAMVGRSEELQAMRDHWRSACEGSGRVVVVTGEAGVGKSRLVEEFREELADVQHSWLEAACSRYDSSAPLAPLAALQRRGLGISDDTSIAERRRRLAAAFAGSGPSTERAVDLLGEMHGISAASSQVTVMPAERRRDERIEVMVEWLLATSRIQPVVMFLDDLHWADPSTLLLTQRLVERVPTESVMVVVTTRADDPQAWKAVDAVEEIDLRRLSGAEIEMVASRAAGSRLSEGQVESIVERADGVPLFAEELATTLAGDAMAGDGVPATLQDLLMARLDRNRELRDVAQMASIIGRDFRLEELQIIADIDAIELRALVEAGVECDLLRRHGSNEGEYAFKHALMSDALYESMLAPTRRRLHRRLATGIIDRLPVLAEDRPDLVAIHLSEAVVPDRATIWWARAGDRAVRRGALAEAGEFYRRALETCGSDDHRRWSLLLDVGGVTNATLGFAAVELGDIWNTAVELAASRQWPRELAVSRLARCLHLQSSGDLMRARAEFDEVFEATETPEDLRQGARRRELLNLCFEGHPRRALEVVDEYRLRKMSPCPELDRASGGQERLGVLGEIVFSECMAGRFGDAQRTMADARSRWDAASPLTAAHLRMMCGTYWMLRGEYAACLEDTEELMEVSRRYGLTTYLGIATLMRSVLRALAAPGVDRPDEMAMHLDDVVGAGTLAGSPFVLSMVAEAEVVCGAPERARSTLEFASWVAQQTNQHLADPMIEAARLSAGVLDGDLEHGWQHRLEQELVRATSRGQAVGRLRLAVSGAIALMDTPGHAAGCSALRSAIDGIPDANGAPRVAAAEQLLVSLE